MESEKEQNQKTKEWKKEEENVRKKKEKPLSLW